MKKQLGLYLGILLYLICQSAFAGAFFKVSATGSPAQIAISLCLNAKGPLSCQNYNVTALDLSILTTIPNHNYPAAGIKIKSPGYKIAGIGVQCTPISNGYCIFAVNSVTPAFITLTKTGLTVPGTPTNVQTQIGNGEVTVTWAPPFSDGGSPITSYTVTSSPPGTTPNVCTSISSTSCVFTGLTNGTPYTFTVVATNADGTGSSSIPTNPVTPALPPGAPTGVNVTMGNGQVMLSWTAPASDGGSPITSYTVTPTPGASASPDTTCNAGGTATFCTFAGLTNGTSYTFTVVANNAVGGGAASPSSTPVIPATVPGAPTGVNVTMGNGQVMLSWTAPASDGGSPITSYTVTPTPGASASPDTTCNTGGTATFCTFAGLTNGTSYTFTVVANNAVGGGAASSSSTPVIPATVPGAPTGVNVTMGNGQVMLSWTAPASDGGSPITSYTVTPTPGASASPDTTCNTGGTATFCTFAGLTNGTSYTFTVVANNAVGGGAASPSSTPVIPATVPGAPTGVNVTMGNGQVMLTWTAPTSDGGSPVTSYTVTPTPGASASPDTTCNTGGTATFCTFAGLTNGTSYTFTVVANNAVGGGAASPSSNPVIPATLPGAPTSVNATGGNAQAILTWTAPVSDGGSAITGYTVTSNPLVTTPAACSNVGTTGCTFTGLTNGTAYTFIVTATNAVGTGPSSAPSTSVTPATIPGAPTAVSGAPGNTLVTVSWTAPASGGSPITGYTVTSSPVLPTPIACNGTVNLSCIFTGLTNDTTAYSFTVTATNAVGTGPSSSASSAVTPAAALYVAEDAGGNNLVFSTNGGASWTPTATVPASGVSGMYVDSNTWYVAGSTGSVLITINNGGSWTPHPVPGSPFLGNIFVSGNVWYLFNASSGGIDYSSDGGVSVTAIPSLPAGGLVNFTISGTTIYVITTFSGIGVVSYSTDGGTTWTSTTSPTATQLDSIFVNGNTIYVGAADGTVWSSTSMGAAWTALSPTGGNFVTGLFVGNNRIYAAANDGHLRLSTDGGASWSSILATSSLDSVFVGATALYTGTQTKVEYSLNGGTTWTATTTSPDSSTVLSVLTNGTTLYAGTSNGNVEVSTDNGTTWTPTAVPDAGNAVNSMFMGGVSIYVGTQAGNVKVAANNSGSSWSAVTQPDSGSSPVHSIFLYQNTWYAGTQNGNVYVSTNSGTSWTATTQPDGSAVNGVYATGTTLYAGTQNGNVKISTNGGTSWTTATQPGAGVAVKSITLKDTTLYVGMADGNVKYSMDNGTTWQATNAMPNGANPVNSVYMSNFIL